MMEFILRRIVGVVICHLLGDYVLQTDFIAKTKGENRYHMFAHCTLYVVPFYICFGYSWSLYTLFASHYIVDLLKARYGKISYAVDQAGHYLIGIILYVIPIILLR